MFFSFFLGLVFILSFFMVGTIQGAGNGQDGVSVNLGFIGFAIYGEHMEKSFYEAKSRITGREGWGHGFFA